MIEMVNPSRSTYPPERPPLVDNSGPVNCVDIRRLTDDELLRLSDELARRARAAVGDLIESLAEIDARKLYMTCGYASLFDYCVCRLKLSEAAAYRRIRAARAVRAYPPIGLMLFSGKLTLESLAILHPFLNDADAGALLNEASGKRVWEVEKLVAGRRGRAPLRDTVRFIPLQAPGPLPQTPPPDQPSLDSMVSGRSMSSDPRLPEITAQPDAAHAGTSPSLPAPKANTQAMASPGVRVAFTADASFFQLLRQAQAAMRHKYPNGRLDGIFRDALEALLRRQHPWTIRGEKP
mgnify:CR=1 FL=1